MNYTYNAMKYAIPFLIIFLCVLSSCSKSKVEDKKEDGDPVSKYLDRNDSTKSSTTVEGNSASQNNLDEIVSAEIRPAIVTAQEAVIWNQPSFNGGREVGRLPRASMINILEQTEKLVTPKDRYNSRCGNLGYHFFKISFQKNGENRVGWIYGTEIHLVDNFLILHAGNKPFEWLRFKDHEYEINGAASDGIGSYNSKGATDCDDTYVVFFQLINSEKIFLVKAEQNAFGKNVTLMKSSANGLLELAQSSNGGFCKITSLNAEMCDGEMSIVLGTSLWYPDGKDGKGKICIHEKNGELVVVKVSEIATH